MPNTSGRRHKQAKNGFAHLAPRQRPNYKRRDVMAARKRLAEQMQKEKDINRRRGESKAKK